MLRGKQLKLFRRAISSIILLCFALVISTLPFGPQSGGSPKPALAVGVGCGSCGGTAPTVDGSDPSGAKVVIRGPVIFEYQPSGGGDTADVYIPGWQGISKQQFVNFNQGNIPKSYAQSDIDDMWSKVWGSDATATLPSDGSFLSYLQSNAPSWDACEGGQIASAPNIPTSSTDAACDSSANKISNAIAIYPGKFQGRDMLVYQIPASDVDSSASDLLNGKGSYFPKFYEANNHSTLGGVGANINNNVDYFFGEGFGAPWKSLNIQRDIQVTSGKKDYTGPALYFGHAYQATNVLSDAINGVLTDIYNAIAGLGNDILHLVDGLITSSQNNVINQAGVTKAWGQMRLIVDILFILVLLVIAFANTLHINLEQYGIRALLPRFIIAVVGVNFSLILVQVIVDFCTVLSSAFIGSTVGFGRLFQLNLGDFPLSDTVGLIVSIILMVIALLAAAAVIAMLIARIAALWVLAALAPLAFLCLVLPVTRGLWNSWLRNVVRFALIGPLMAVLILLASDFATSQGNTVATDLLTFLIVVGLLYAAALIPLMLGGAITSAASSFANRGQRLATQNARRAAVPVAKRTGKAGLYAGGAATRLIAKGPGAIRGQRGLVGTGEATRPTGKYSKFLPVGLMATKRGQKISGALANTPFVGTNKRLLPTRAERYQEARLATDIETLKSRNLANPQLNALVGGRDPRRAAAAAMVAAERGTLSSGQYSKLFDRPGISPAVKADIWSEAVKNYAPIMYDAFVTQPRPNEPDPVKRAAAAKRAVDSAKLAGQIATLGPSGEGRLSSRLSNFAAYSQRRSTGDLIKDMPPEVARVYDFAAENRVISERQFDNLSLGRQEALRDNPTMRGRIGKKSTAGILGDDGSSPSDGGGGDSTPPPAPSGGGGPSRPPSGGPTPTTPIPNSGSDLPTFSGSSGTSDDSGSSAPAPAPSPEQEIVKGINSYKSLSEMERMALRERVRGMGGGIEGQYMRRALDREIMNDPYTPAEEKMSARRELFGRSTLPPSPGAQYSAWNIDEGYTEGEHGEFPEPEQGGEEQE